MKIITIIWATLVIVAGATIVTLLLVSAFADGPKPLLVPSSGPGVPYSFEWITRTPTPGEYAPGTNPLEVMTP